MKMRRIVIAATVLAGAVASVGASAAPPFVGPNVNMVQGTKWPQGDPFLTKQNEESHAISSRNPRHILAGSNDYRLVPVEIAEELDDPEAWVTLYKSVDGGATWRAAPVGGCPINIPECNDATGLTAALKALKPNFGADPTVRAGPFGTFFLSFIAGTRDTNSNGVIALQRFVDKNNDIQRTSDVRACTSGPGCIELFAPPTCTGPGAGCTSLGKFKVKATEDPILPDTFFIVDTGTPGQGKDKPWNAADVPRSWNAGKTCELLSWTKTASGMKNVAETVPAFNVYVSYANFKGQDPTNPNPFVNVAVSSDCGKTFAKGTQVSKGGSTSQGSSIAIDPTNGAVYVSWRGFTPNAIYVVKSTDGGKTWSKPVTVSNSSYYPYDQGATGVTMRTLGFPTIAVSVKNGQSRVHVAWAQRKAPPGTTPPYACQSSTPSDCDARIVMSTSTNGGNSWSTPTAVDSNFTVTALQPPANTGGNSQPYAHSRGHQMQPSLTFAAGKLVLTWLDSRLDATEGVLQCPAGNTCTNVNDLVEARRATGNLDRACNRSVLSSPYGPACFNPNAVFSTYLSDGTPGLVRRHTIDVYAAMFDPTDTLPLAAGSSARVSQYAFGSTVAGTIDPNTGVLTPQKGTYEIRQKEVHAPNLPLFANGTGAFVGDYIDVVGQTIVATGDSAHPYKWNVGGTVSATDPFMTSGLPPVFYASWTDNRDVIPPVDGNWVTPSCLTAALVEDALGNVTGSTNNNSCSGVGAGYSGNRNQNVYSAVVAENSYAVGNATAKLLDPNTPRGFVVSVRNLSNAQHTYTIDVATGQTTGVKAAFNRESLLPAPPTPPARTTSLQVTVQPRSTSARTIWVTSSVAKAPVIVNVTSPAGDGNLSSKLVFNGDQTANLDAVPANGQFVINGDGGGADTANDNLGNVVLSNAVLTNNVLTNNALTNAVLTNNALTNAALSNVVLSNAVLTNNVLSNNALTNVVLTNDAVTNNALTNNVLSNAALSNTALNVALTNLDPANVALSNAALTNNALTNVALTNNALTNVMLTNAALTNAALTNVALSNNALTNNVLTNNALSNVALTNAPLVDTNTETQKNAIALQTIETGSFEIGSQFTSNDFQNSDVRETSFTVRNHGNTDATLSMKLMVRDAICTPDPGFPSGITDGSGHYTCATPGYKLQLVLRKLGLIPYAIPPTGPAVDTGRAFQIGLLQRNTDVSNVGTLPIVSPDDPNLGKFLVLDPNAATLPVGAGEYAYATIRAVGIGGLTPPNPEDLLRWGVQAIAANAGNVGNPFTVTTLSFPANSVTALQNPNLLVRSIGGTGSVAGTAICTDNEGTAVSIADPPAFVPGPPGYTRQASVACAGAPITVTDDGTSTRTAKLSFTPKYWGEFYVRASLQDGSSPPQTDQQVIKVVVQPKAPVVSFGASFPTQVTYQNTVNLTALVGSAITTTSTSTAPFTFTASLSATNACYVDVIGGNYTLHVDRSSTVAAGNPSICVIAVHQDGNETYAPITVQSPAITILQAQQIIAFGTIPAHTYGDASFQVSATSTSPTAAVSSGNPIVFTSSTGTACGTSGTNGTKVDILNAAIVAPGCSINANQLGNANYLNAAQVTQSFLINQKPASVTPDGKTKTYGDADPPLTGVLAGFVATDNITATYSRTPGETVAGSPYTISASLSSTSARPLTNYIITSNTANFTITRRNTSTGVVTSLTPAPTGSSVTFTATVSPVALPVVPATGTVAPTGTVQFRDGTTVLGTQPLATVTGTFTATASLSTSSLAVGTHTITAVYSSDGNYNGSTSSGLTQIVDTPPEVLADAYSVLKDTVLTVGMPGLLGNDRDVDPGDTLTTALPVLSQPTHSASFTANSDGSLSYTPQSGFIGADTFTYQATDGYLAGQARTVTISVVDPAATLVAENDAYSVPSGAADPLLTVAAPGVMGNDFDEITGTVTTVLEPGGEPLHAKSGGFTLNPDGSFTYTPEAGFTGRDRFLYRLHAGASTSNLAMVTIAVLPAGTTLVAGNDAYIGDEDTPLTVLPASSVLVNDPTATGALRVSGPLYGTVALQTDGSFVYTPNPGFSGMDSFTYIATTGSTATNNLAGSNLAMVTILVRSKTTTTIDAPNVTYPADGVVTVSVDASYGTPTGNVSLTVDGGAPIVQPLDGNGESVFNLSGLNAGAHGLSATYAAQGSFGASSGTGTLQVDRAATMTTVTAPNASYDNTPHSGSAAVSGPGGLSQSGLAVTYAGRNGTTYPSSATAPTGAGDYTASASYAGSTNYLASNGSADYTIAQATTTTTVNTADATYDANPHSATASTTGAGGLNASPTVTYAGTGTTSYGPSATAPTNAGTYNALASYTATTNYAGSSDNKNFTIAKANQAIAFGPLANKTTADPAFSVSAMSSSPTAPTSTMSIVFASQTQSQCTATGANGTTITIVAAGTCTIAADQAGDANYNAAPQVTQSFMITTSAGTATTTTVVSSNATSTFGEGVTFTATVTGGSSPTGTVHFKDGGFTIVGCVAAPLALNAGQYEATCLINNLYIGSHAAITAVYSGDTNNLTSTSAPITQAITGTGAVTPMLAGGRTHTCALDDNGDVWCWGRDDRGELGDGSTNDEAQAVSVGVTNEIDELTSGAEHSCTLDSTNNAMCWGDNTYGQLGYSTSPGTSSTTPSAVVGLPATATAISAGFEHTCAISGGGVYCWGRNQGGQLGDGTTNNQSAPTQVPGLSGVTAIAAAQVHTCVLTSGNSVKCWGTNDHGQLGDGTNSNSLAPVDVSGLGSGVAAVVGNGGFTCALMETGGVKCWGYNGAGAVGDGTGGDTTNNFDRNVPTDVVGLGSGVTAITAGGGHACALLATGGVKCWGYNGNGQTGDGGGGTRASPVSVFGLPTGASTVTGGGDHTCASVIGGASVAGTVYCWGFNNHGQIGNGAASSTPQLTPAPVQNKNPPPTNFTVLP